LNEELAKSQTDNVDLQKNVLTLQLQIEEFKSKLKAREKELDEARKFKSKYEGNLPLPLRYSFLFFSCALSFSSQTLLTVGIQKSNPNKSNKFNAMLSLFSWIP